MQDVTNLPYLQVLTALGCQADVYVTPYFRVVSHSDHLDVDLARLVCENPTRAPLYAQIIGSDVAAMCRVAQALEKLPVAGIDLNIGCPAPIVCRKSAGGGALRDRKQLLQTLLMLREAVRGRFTVKTRIGYESFEEWESLLDVFRQVSIEQLVVHGRTVREGYRTAVHDECIRRAVEVLSCPVIANGNVIDADNALQLLKNTGAAGLMMGRGAVRNPWIFEQIRSVCIGVTPRVVLHEDIYRYIMTLYEKTEAGMHHYVQKSHINRMKKYLVYIAEGMPDEFGYQMRRAETKEVLFSLCRDYFDNTSPYQVTPPSPSKLFAGHEAR